MADLIITLTIPSAERARVVNAFATEYGYLNENPKTKEEFLEEFLVNMIRLAVESQEDKAALVADRAVRAALPSITKG